MDPIQLVRIRPGEKVMGSTDSDIDPQHCGKPKKMSVRNTDINPAKSAANRTKMKRPTDLENGMP